MNYVKEYWNWIEKNPDRVCVKIKTIYQKLVDDIDHPKQVEIYNKNTEEYDKHTYVFDEEKGLRPILFIEKYCKHSKGKWSGQPIKLELWQKAFIQAAYGFIDNETGLRRFIKILLFVARKNGKSTIDSGLGNFHLTKDGEGGAEVYSVAVKKDQAKIVWEESKKMIKKSPALNKRCRCLINGIFFDANDSKFMALASDSNSMDGLNASCVLADEVHAWKDKNLMDVMFDSMSAREQPMFIETSTMGTVRDNVFDNEYEYASKVITGEVIDYQILPVIYELDNKDEWIDEIAWEKANPALGTIKSKDALRNKVERAKANPNELVNLLCKDFNVRMIGDDHWLTYDDVSNDLVYEIDELRDNYAVGGVDLSSTTDLTCATCLIKKNGQVYVLQRYFIPDARLEEKIKEDKIPYDVWSARDLVTLCPGAKVDYSAVSNWFLKLINEYEIRPIWIGYDPWNSNYWVEEMKGYGFTMEEVRQGAKTMSNPMKQLEADLIENKVNYNQNPVLHWCLTNTAVNRDENDNIRPVKGKQQRARIDGAVSLIIAYTVMLNHVSDLENLMEE